jgi:membrane protease YdiL (CAAX protease family)
MGEIMKRIFKTIGYILLVLTVYIALQFIVSFTGMFILGFEAWSSSIFLIMIIAGVLSLLIYLPICKKKKLGFVNTGFKEKVQYKDLLILSVICIAVTFFNQYYLTFLNSFESLSKAFDKFEETFYFLQEGSFVLKVITIVILGPFIEELIFRVMIFKDLENKTNSILALIVQAVLFGLYHFLLVQALYAIPMGLLFGYLYMKKRSFWLVFIAHALINFFALITPELLTDIPEGVFGYIIIIISAAVITAGVLYYKKNGKLKITENMEEQTNET